MPKTLFPRQERRKDGSTWHRSRGPWAHPKMHRLNVHAKTVQNFKYWIKSLTKLMAKHGWTLGSLNFAGMGKLLCISSHIPDDFCHGSKNISTMMSSKLPAKQNAIFQFFTSCQMKAILFSYSSSIEIIICGRHQTVSHECAFLNEFFNHFLL